MFTITNLNRRKKLTVRPAQNKSFVEVSWTDGGGTRFMWLDPDQALGYAAQMALEAAKAKAEQTARINAPKVA